MQLWGPGTGSSNGLTVSPVGGAFIGSTPGFHNGPISQTLTGLVIGVPVAVTFDWAGAQQFGFNGPTDEGWAVSLRAQTLDTALVSTSSHGFSGWQTASLTFTPTSSSEVLSFLATGTKANPDPQAFALLDSVSVDPIPEPSTWAISPASVSSAVFAARTVNSVVLRELQRPAPPPRLNVCSQSATMSPHERPSLVIAIRDLVRGLADEQAQDRIVARLARVRLGNFGDAKAVGDGVRELRIDAGPGYRVYFVRREAAVYVLLTGGDKGSQKRDIEAAKAMARELKEEDR